MSKLFLLFALLHFLAACNLQSLGKGSNQDNDAQEVQEYRRLSKLYKGLTGDFVLAGKNAKTARATCGYLTLTTYDEPSGKNGTKDTSFTPTLRAFFTDPDNLIFDEVLEARYFETEGLLVLGLPADVTTKTGRTIKIVGNIVNGSFNGTAESYDPNLGESASQIHASDAASCPSSNTYSDLFSQSFQGTWTGATGTTANSSPVAVVFKLNVLKTPASHGVKLLLQGFLSYNGTSNVQTTVLLRALQQPMTMFFETQGIKFSGEMTLANEITGTISFPSFSAPIVLRRNQ